MNGRMNKVRSSSESGMMANISNPRTGEAEEGSKFLGYVLRSCFKIDNRKISLVSSEFTCSKYTPV